MKNSEDTTTLTFRYMIDFYANQQDADRISRLYVLLKERALIDDLLRTNLIDDKEIQYLLECIRDSHSLFNLTQNQLLLTRIYENMLLDQKTIHKLNRIITNTACTGELTKVKNFFDLVALNVQTDYFDIWDGRSYKNYKCINDELLIANTSYSYVFSLDLTKKSLKNKKELYELLKKSEAARSIMKSIIDNNLQDQYDFETLKNLLNREDNKKLKTKFNF